MFKVGLCHLIGVFRPVTFSAIICIMKCKPDTLLHVFLLFPLPYTPVGSGGGGPPILQRGSFTSQNPGPEGDGGNLQFTLHRPKTATPENCELTAWLSNKNQNPTLHFRPVNRAACAGEVFRCALRPPS